MKVVIYFWKIGNLKINIVSGGEMNRREREREIITKFE